MLNSSNQQNTNIIGGKKSISFKEWKILKNGNNQKNEKQENNERLNASGNSGNRFNNNSVNGPRNYFISGSTKNFSCNSGTSGFLQFNNLNGLNNYNKFNMHASNFRSVNYNCFTNYSPRNNNLNRANTVCFNAIGIKFNNYQNEYQNYRKNHYENNDLSRRANNNNFGQSDNFFTSDCVYSQRDMMQKPLKNPFRYSDKGDQLLQEFEKSKCFKKVNNKKSTRAKDSNFQNPSDETRKRPKEPEVYISNPKAEIDGKSYIPKPKVPEVNLEITREEKKQQWKEYRQAMKPFKNRDFYNNKRVVQRLSKKSLSELDEKELIRLTKAKEYMDAYKARLCAKYPNYVKAEDSSDELGELYVLKKVPINQSSCLPKPFTKEKWGSFDTSQTKEKDSSCKAVETKTQFIAGNVVQRPPNILSTNNVY